MTVTPLRPVGLDRNEWRDAVWSSDLKPLRRLAALCYADHAGQGARAVWVTTKRGMDRTGMGRSAWHESRNELVTTGWLQEVVPPTHTEAGRYQLTVPSQFAERSREQTVP